MVCISAFFLITAVFCSCSDDVVTPPPDPCAGATRTSANFTMKEIVWDSLRYDTDTIITGNTVEFSAKDSADEYLWTMSGTDQIWTKRTFRLKFYDFIGSVDVQLVVRRNTPNIKCFPDDKTTDTIIRRLVVVDDYQSKILGQFRGVSTNNLLDTFTVGIKIFGRFPQDLRWLFIINLPNGTVDTADSWYYIYRAIGYEQFLFNCRYGGKANDLPWLYPSGFAMLSPDDNHLLIDYTVRDTTQPFDEKPIKLKHYTFKGIRQ